MVYRLITQRVIIIRIGEKVDKYNIRISVGITMLVLLLAGAASATTHTVCLSGCDNTSIQAAIDDVNTLDGDTIEVHSGTYYETVNVNKPLILRGVDIGGGKPIVNATGYGNAIVLSADGITIDGFVPIKSISHLIFVSSNNSKIVNNTLRFSNNNGIQFNNSSWNYISNNEVGFSYNFGFFFVNSSNNNVIGNNLTHNGGAGMRFDYSNYNNIIANNASNNTRPGIRMIYSSYNIIADNNLNNNVRFGINLGPSSNNNIISNNYITNNIIRGFNLIGPSNNNLIYNNLFNNSENFRSNGISQNNTWNISKSAGTNIINGLNIAGNFWANPAGMDFSQTCFDSDNDNICDSAFSLNSNNTDFLPLADLNAPPSPSEIHGKVFMDSNGNGIMDAGESNISGVLVNLTRLISPGVEFQAGTESTDTNGNYSFTGISSGYYRIEEFPVGSVQTSPANGKPQNVTLGVAEIRNGVDFGNQEISPGEIHGIKFNDYNGNGTMDQGESGIQGVSICIFTWRCTLTDPSGDYSFLNLSPGTYTVYEIMPSGYYPTTPPRVTTAVNPGDVKIINFSNYKPVPMPEDISVEQQTGEQYGVPTVYWPEVTVLNITKNLTQISSNIISVKLIMNFNNGTTMTAYMTQNGSTNIWEANFSQPFPHNSIAHLTFEVDVAPAGPENDVIEKGDLIFIDPSGKIIDACTGSPIRDATVTLFVEYPSGSGSFIESPDENQIPVDNPLITGDDGRYRWDVVPGTYKVRAEKAGYGTVESDLLIIPPPVTDLDISLSPTGGCGVTFYNITGSVLNASSGLGISGSLVKFDDYPQYNDTTNITGYYLMSVPAGNYNISASAAGYSINTSLVTINANTVQDFALFVLPSIWYINGTVKDSSTGNNLSGVTISANTTLSTTTDAIGFYSFAVTDGTYNLVSTINDIRFYTNTTTVSTNGQAVVWRDIEMVRKPTGNITGSVTRGT